MTTAQNATRLVILIAVIAGLGWYASQRVSFNTDPLNMLPSELPEATGLKLFEARFGKDIDLMVTLEGDDPDIVESAAQSLTEHLLATPGLVANAYWKPPGADSHDIDPRSFAELIAYAWMNAPPESWDGLLTALEPAKSDTALQDAFNTLAYGQILDPQLSMFRASTDPLGVVYALPGFEKLLNSGDDAEQFSADEGRFHLVRAEAPNDIADYKLTIAWLANVEPAIRAWHATSPAFDSIKVDWTGRAPYTAEIASAMEGEMKLSVIFAIVLIHTLFFIFYRRFIPIIWLVLCLALTFTITLTIGSFIFEELGATSVGFAAILVGLAVDYGFVIYQESLHCGSEPKPLRKKLTHSIAWASITTAAVFIGLRLSSLPGASQLGTMVGIGITVGAIVMITVFTWLNHISPPTLISKAAPLPNTPLRHLPERFFTLTLAAVATLILLVIGQPAISTSADDLRPKESHASDVFRTVWEKFGWGKHGGFRVVIAGENEEQISDRIQQLHQILANDKSDIAREVVFPPAFLLANLSNQNNNRANLHQAIAAAKLIQARAKSLPRPDNLDPEHVDEMLELSAAIFTAWERFASLPPDLAIIPTDPSSRWVLDNVVSRDQSPVCALGTIQLPANSDAVAAEELRLAALLGTDGIYPAGWSLLRPAIVRIMKHEFFWVVIPMASILLVMLWLAFRSFRRVLLSIAALAFSFTCLLAIMSLLEKYSNINTNWNLMNLAAIPIILGAGLDYSIHMQLALKRLNGNTVEARRTIGRALILCGLSTATGFGTLITSSNAGLSSLGLVCTIGMLVTMLTCVYLLPAWDQWTDRQA